MAPTSPPHIETGDDPARVAQREKKFLTDAPNSWKIAASQICPWRWQSPTTGAAPREGGENIN